MARKGLFLLLILTIFAIGELHSEDDPSASWREPFNEAEMAALQLCLDAANLSLRDLSFEKKLAPAPYLLDVVRNMMDEPLYSAKVADMTSRSLYRAARHPQKAIQYCESLLGSTSRVCESELPSFEVMKSDLKKAWSDQTGIQAINALESLPRSLANALYVAFWGAYMANVNVAEATANLSDDERGLLVSAMPTIWADEPLDFAPNHSAKTKNISATELFKIADKVNLNCMACAATVLCNALDRCCDMLRSSDIAAIARQVPFSEGILTINTPLGQLVIGGTGDDYHYGSPAFILDLAGDDTYYCPVASAINAPSGSGGITNRPVSFAIDLSGSDRYLPIGGFGCGFGLLGVAALFECSGDDEYRTGNDSLGTGIIGVGVLIELDGSDRYEGDSFSQGAGFFGIGLLADARGNDRYHAAKLSQGFGFVRGIGALSDDSGTDIYFAGGKYPHTPLLPNDFQSLSQGCGFGFRDVAAGGVGILCDAEGKDFYTGDVYAQASGYFYAAGILVDGSGNDVYTTTQYSQGAGIHLAVGVLLDRSGFDHYYCRYGVGMGGAHDYAVGLLMDLDGTDFYTGSGITQGGANTNSVAIFLDSGNGADAYSGIGDFLQGKGAQSRDTASIGIMIDMGGADTYSTGLLNGELRVSGVYGVAYDLPDPKEEK